MGVTLGRGRINKSTLQLNFKKGAMIKKISASFASKDLIEDNRSVMYSQSTRLSFQNNSKLIEEVDFQLYGYILKIITQKSLTHTSEIEIWKFIVLTSEQDLVCIEVADRGFILQAPFPKEKNFIFLDNLQFVNCT